jgi:hypothetical protein
MISRWGVRWKCIGFADRPIVSLPARGPRRTDLGSRAGPAKPANMAQLHANRSRRRFRLAGVL